MIITWLVYLSKFKNNTECVVDLNWHIEMIILSHFWPLLKLASFHEAARAMSEIGSDIKSNY
jgi:hypothetical protein